MLPLAKTRLILSAAVVMLATDGVAPAQSSVHTPAFIGVGFGPFWSDRSNFAETYGSGPVLAGAVGFGVPVVRKVHLYGKVLYIARKSVDQTAQFQQLLFDVGLQYNLPLLNIVTLAFQGGAAFCAISEHMQYEDGTSVSKHGSGLQGLFAGLGADRKLERSPWSFFGEIQYNSSRSDVASLGESGGFSVSLGVRYRFSDHEDSDKDATSRPSIWGQ